MGLFCVNLHVLSTSEVGVRAALSRRGISRYHATPPENGWISVYDAVASEQDETYIRELAGGLSSDLDSATMAFLVHDSDMACYWLFERGQLLDHFNSFPDYFSEDDNEEENEDDEHETLPEGSGQPEVLARFCRQGTPLEELAEILSRQPLFAEELIEQIAGALGISRDRALADYRDVEAGDLMTSENDSPGRESSASEPLTRMAALLTKTLSPKPRTDSDPNAVALVEATARGDLSELQRLLAAGADANAEAPAPHAAAQALGAMESLLGGALPTVPSTPLMTAILHQQRPAAELLLESGADVNRLHPLWGRPVHVACGAGNHELLQLLIDHGADLKAQDAQGQSPLEYLRASRTAGERLEQAWQLMQSLGAKLPRRGTGAPWESFLTPGNLPQEGWTACERLLKKHRGA